MSPSSPSANSRLLVMGTVGFYLVAALAMVMANKWVLKETDVPLFFLFTQLVIAVILFIATHLLGFIQIPLVPDLATCKGLAPMVALNVLGLSSSNFTLKYVDASFYQVARGLLLPFTVLTSYLFLRARPSPLILLACSFVTIGFFIGVFLDAVYPSRIGIVCGILSSMTTAVHSVVIKRSMDLVGGSALVLGWYQNLLSAFALIPVIVIAGEVPRVTYLFAGSNMMFGTGPALRAFIYGSMITGVFGFLMSIASLMSIKVTSPITHMVSSAVRGVAASFLGVWLFHDIITTGRAASIAVILVGSIYYTWLKHLESQPANAPITSARASTSDEKGSYERVALNDIESGNRKPE